jgi:glucose/arabinose dehydrogenase
MVIVTKTGEISEAIDGIPTVNASGQGGLLGLTLDPDFAKNRMVYWTFSQKTDAGNLTAVAKGKLSADEKRMENAVVIYQSTPAFNGDLHYGSRIVLIKQEFNFSTGERDLIRNPPKAQDLNTSLEKLFASLKMVRLPPAIHLLVALMPVKNCYLWTSKRTEPGI